MPQAQQQQRPPQQPRPEQRREREVVADIPPQLTEGIKHLKETLQANFYDAAFNLLATISVRELTDKLATQNEIHAIVFDGVITQRLVDIATEKNVKYLIGARKSTLTKTPMELKIVTFNQVN